jgi:hypothetical protein
VNEGRGRDQKIHPRHDLSLIEESCLDFAEVASNLKVDVQDGYVGEKGQQPL